MQYATYTRQPRARKYVIHSVVPVEGERGAYSAALRSLPRRQGDVEQFPITDTFIPPTEVPSAGISTLKVRATDALVKESAEAAARIVEAGIIDRKFDAGTNYGLAYAVQRILRSQGKNAFMSKSFMLFGNDSSKYEVSIL